MTLYIYADETEFELNNDKLIGAGLIVVKSPINNITITEALCNLKDDPDINKDQFKIQDSKTLKRGYFHASDDSQNAHSHFCKSIIKYVKGNFVYSYFNPSREESRRNKRTLNALQKLTLKLASVSVFYTAQEVIFTIEERNNFNINDANSWIEGLYKQMEYSIYDSPPIPKIFPCIELKTARKETPGLQVVDFILWSMNRSKRTPPHDDWREHLNLKLSVAWKEVEGPIEKGTYILGDEVEIPYPHYPDFCLPVKDPIGCEGLIKTYILIEQYLKYVSKQIFPPHAEHLKYKVINIVNQLSKKDAKFSDELIREVSSVFLRLFDTLPIYDGLNESDKDTWTKFLTARRMASLFLREDLNGVDSCDYIALWRRNTIKENSQILDI